LLDSGCEITMIPKSTIDEIGGLPLLPSHQRICAANNTEIEIIGRVIAPFRLGDHVFEADALVFPDVNVVMLGSNWLRRHKCLWDFGTSRLYINGQPADLLSNDEMMYVRATHCLQSTSEPVLAADVATDAVWELSLSEMHLNDPEIGFVLRSLMESTERPDHASIAASSAFVKLLGSQWKLLHIVDGVLYRRFSYTDGRLDVLQLLVPFAMRKDFLRRMLA